VSGEGGAFVFPVVSIPGCTTRVEESLNSPYMDEMTVGYSLTFGSNRGFVRADYVDRTWDDFYTLRPTLETGKATGPSGLLVDQGVIENSRGGLSREYQAVQLRSTRAVRLDASRAARRAPAASPSTRSPATNRKKECTGRRGRRSVNRPSPTLTSSRAPTASPSASASNVFHRGSERRFPERRRPGG
jgi:hypothetical protein